MTTRYRYQRPFNLLIFCFFSLSLPRAVGSKPTSPSVIPSEQIEVSAAGGLKCRAYLFRSDKQPKPLVFQLDGTGIYSKGALTRKGQEFFGNEFDFLTMDKPGIKRSERGDVELDSDTYEQHTQRDLVSCAHEALVWALTRLDSSIPVFLVGHSEGTQVLVRMYQNELDTNSTVSKRIKGILLNGLPMRTWKDAINDQLNSKQRADFWKAFEVHESKTLRKYGELAYPYWSDILMTPTLRKAFEELAKKGKSVPIYVFQGLNDKETPAKFVMEFEKWNQEREEKKVPSLCLTARYYNADHGLNDAAQLDHIATLRNLVSGYTHPCR